MGQLKLQLIIGAIAAVLIFAIGFKVGGWRCAAQQVAVIDDIKKLNEQKAAQFNEQQKRDAQTMQALAVKLIESKRRTDALRKELRDAELGKCVLTADFTRLYDDAVHAAGP